jgi:hypothetical protein
MLTKMPDYLINSDGAVKEYAWPTLEDNYQHRHNSHLYPLWFGDFSGDPRLEQGFRRAIELRLQARVHQDGGWMPFGMTQMGQAATTLRDSATAWLLTRWIVNGYYFTGLAPSIEPGPRIFNLDIAGSLPDVMIRMLVQSQPGTVQLLPALPADWASGSIGGVLTRTRVTVKSLRWDSNAIQVTLNSAMDQTITLSAPRTIASIREATNKVQVAETGSGDRRRISLPAHQDVDLRIELK